LSNRRQQIESGPDRRRALELLAASPDGCTEAILRAHGFSTAQVVDLVRAGLATAHSQRVIVGAGGHFSLSSAQGIGRAWGIPLRASTPLPERRLEVPFNSPVAAADAGRMCLRPLTQSDKTSLGPISSRKDWASAIPSASLGSRSPRRARPGKRRPVPSAQSSTDRAASARAVSLELNDRNIRT
jgi:hypothetical protein